MNLPTTVAEFNAIDDSDSRLAIELALQIRSIPDVLKTYSLARSDLARKLRQPMFRDMVKQAKILWNSDLSIKERIRLKSQVLVEDSLLSIFQIVHAADNAIPAKLDAFKQLSKIAEVEAPERKQNEIGSRFTVHINLGDNIAPVVIEGSTDHDQ